MIMLGIPATTLFFVIAYPAIAAMDIKTITIMYKTFFSGLQFVFLTLCDV
jgi:hypothetical protein